MSMYSWIWATTWAVIGVVWARDVASIVCIGMMVAMHLRWVMQAMDLEEQEQKQEKLP